MKTLLYIALLGLCSVAQAAKVPVTWTNPSQNTDNTPLTDLSYVIVEWGSCNGTAFGTMQSSRLIATTEAGASMNSFVYPTGLSRVCIRVLAVNMAGASSDYSNVAAKDLLPAAGKPVTLGQPVVIP